MLTTTDQFNQYISWIKSFINDPNATQEEWEKYDMIIKKLGKDPGDMIFSENQKEELRNALKAVITEKTIQGHIFHKPHGYAGDYELIDKFYTMHKSPDEKLAKWDEYLHSFPAAHAVRNRKNYIKDILKEKCGEKVSETFEMLNLASGPARDIYEFLDENPSVNFHADCIDLDNNAIQYAKVLLNGHNDKVSFINKNILRFTTDKKYDLVWSAGLFDYFDDNIFKRLITRFLNNVKPGGELIVGNFCSSNPNIHYMEILDWILHHRSAENLITLVTDCGVSTKDFVIEKEPAAVNLFVRIRV